MVRDLLRAAVNELQGGTESERLSYSNIDSGGTEVTSGWKVIYRQEYKWPESVPIDGGQRELVEVTSCLIIRLIAVKKAPFSVAICLFE